MQCAKRHVLPPILKKEEKKNQVSGEFCFALAKENVSIMGTKV